MAPTSTQASGMLRHVSYKEPYRPQFHFSPAKNWMNDPNGLIYHKGHYHMYYQYNPSGDAWGDMSWGHAISQDLLHWKEQPLALTALNPPANPGPGPRNEFFFSGSVVYDKSRSSGLCGSDSGLSIRGGGTRAPLVAVYTSFYPNDITLPTGQAIRAGTQAQSIAYSVDDGLTWTEHDENPVLPLPPSPYEDQWRDFRDPFVFWHEPDQSWVMVVALSQLHKVLFYTSTDLKQWTHRGEFGPFNALGGVWECPSLFPLSLNGDDSTIKWVLVVGLNPGGPVFANSSATQYFVGDFDGASFTADEDSLGSANWLDYGPDYYAAATYNGLDKHERIAIAWMNDWAYAAKIPTNPWRSAMTIPRELTLATIEGGRSRLISTPCLSLQDLERGAILFCKKWHSLPHGNITLPISEKALDMTVSFSSVPSSKQFCLSVRTGADGDRNNTAAATIGYDFPTQRLFVQRHAAGADSLFSTDYEGTYYAPLTPRDGVVSFRVLLDWSSVEVFGGRGECTITAQIFPLDATGTSIALFADGGVKDVSVDIVKVASVWGIENP